MPISALLSPNKFRQVLRPTMVSIAPTTKLKSLVNLPNALGLPAVQQRRVLNPSLLLPPSNARERMAILVFTVRVTPMFTRFNLFSLTMVIPPLGLVR